MVQAQLIKWLIIVTALFCLVGGTWWKVHHLTAQRDEAIAQVTDLTVKLVRSQHDLVEVTASKQELTSAIASANSARNVIQAQLQSTLSKLRSQKPPQECASAITWSVDQKADMDWDKNPAKTGDKQ
jgi:uncharacterized protein YlxW (UPF0749 family)